MYLGDAMEEKNTGRKRIIGLRLAGDEYGVLEKNWKKSTIKKLSEYVRRVLFGKAVTVYKRNQSLDELMTELVFLRKELNAIGVNINQAVHRLHTLDHLPQMQRWAQGFERDKDVFFLKVEEIKLKVNSISEQWLQ
jgi:MobC-like protein